LKLQDMVLAHGAAWSPPPPCRLLIAGTGSRSTNSHESPPSFLATAAPFSATTGSDSCRWNKKQFGQIRQQNTRRP